MTIELQPGAASGKLTAAASKSEAHRLLICAALADKPSWLDLGQPSQDILATMRCLEALGAEIEPSGGRYYLIPINRWNDREPCVMDCGESGSTLRFLMPAAGALGSEAEVRVSGRLGQRPMEPLVEQLKAHGCRITDPDGVTGGRTIAGQLQPGDYRLPGNVSSQFISGLLMALPLLCSDSRLIVEGPLESAGYIDLTIQALKTFGVTLKEEPDGWTIPGVGYCTPGQVRAGGDWSNAAPWLCMGLLGGDGMTVLGLDAQSKQGDKAIVSLLTQMGGQVTQTETEVTVKPGTRQPVTIDARQIPDLVPVLAAAAAAIPGKTRIEGAGRLRLKESDRLATTAQMLTALGAQVEETEDGLLIQGQRTLSGGVCDAAGDHRIAMAAAVASAACTGPVTITGAEAVQKSYPAFWADLKAVGRVVTEQP